MVHIATSKINMKIFLAICIFIAAASAYPVAEDQHGDGHHLQKRQTSITGNFQTSNVASNDNGPNNLNAGAAAAALPGGDGRTFISGNFQSANVASNRNQGNIIGGPGR